MAENDEPIAIDGAAVADGVEDLSQERFERLRHLVRPAGHLLLKVGHGFPDAADRI